MHQTGTKYELIYSYNDFINFDTGIWVFFKLSFYLTEASVHCYIITAPSIGYLKMFQLIKKHPYIAIFWELIVPSVTFYRNNNLL